MKYLLYRWLNAVLRPVERLGFGADWAEDLFEWRVGSLPERLKLWAPDATGAECRAMLKELYEASRPMTLDLQTQDEVNRFFEAIRDVADHASEPYPWEFLDMAPAGARTNGPVRANDSEGAFDT